MVQIINGFFDSLPRRWVAVAWKPAPAFRTCGVIGYYLALILLFAGGLVTGRSLLALSCVAAVCAGTFFGWAYLRRWITGVEELVLLEHVWLAVLATTLVLWLLGVSVLAYLDIVLPALCIFLALGRVGCLVVGCCHGRPSGLGIRYPPELATDDSVNDLAGVRLFPVQAIEAVALVAIAVSGFLALPRAGSGSVLTWCVVAYSITRFGLEGLRGDHRPQWLSLSVARWTCIAQFALALALNAVPMALIGDIVVPAAAVFLVMVLAVCVLLVRHYDRARRIAAPAHVSEVAGLIKTDMVAAASRMSGAPPATSRSSLGVTAAVSQGPREGVYHVSMALPGGRRDLSLLARLSVGALPGLDPGSVAVGDRGVLHFSASESLPASKARPEWQRVCAAAVAFLQSERGGSEAR